MLQQCLVQFRDATFARQTGELDSGDESSDIEDSLNDHKTLMEDIQKMIQRSMSWSGKTRYAPYSWAVMV